VWRHNIEVVYLFISRQLIKIEMKGGEKKMLLEEKKKKEEPNHGLYPIII